MSALLRLSSQQLHLPRQWEQHPLDGSRWHYRVSRLPLGWISRYSPDGVIYYQNTLRHYCTRDDPRTPVRVSVFPGSTGNNNSTYVLHRSNTQRLDFGPPQRSSTVPELYENFEQFDHVPLNSPTSIRLLRWQGREDLGLPSFAVEEFNVAEAPPYIALSYCWGASTENQDETYSSSHQWPILCDEKVVLVGKNLHDFLQQKDPGYHKWKDIAIGGSALHYAAHRGRLEIVANLVKIGADIDSRDDTGRTALYLACEAGHLNIVKFLVSLGANTESRAYKQLSPSMYTSLHMAIAVGRIDIAEALLDGSADIEARLKNNIGPLYHATLRGNAAMVKLLLSRGASTENEVLLEDSTLTAGTPIIKAVMNKDIASIRVLTEHGATLNAVNGYGRTALHFCVAEEDLTDITMYLLEHGASPSVRSHIGWTPLHSAAAHGLPDVIAALLDAGAEIEELEEELGRNPLHLACEFDKADNVAVLLERGAQVNVHRLDDQRTPLHISAGRVSSAVVEKLMCYGAQVHALDSQSQTPLHRAALEITFGNVSDIEKPEAVAKMASGRVDSINLLLKHGARIDDVDESHSTPLLQAARYGNLEAVSALLEASASLEASSDRGFTPLIVASLQDHPKVVEFLVKNGARLDSQDNNGRSPLHAALHWGSPDSANLLCQLRSDIHATDNDGITPLHEAAFHNFADLAERMLDSGADTDAQNDYGSTPLDLAVWQGSQACVQLLLKRGARLNKATLERTETDLKSLEVQQAEYVANENQAHKSELHKDAVSIATESVKPDIVSTQTRAESPVLLAEEGGKNGGEFRETQNTVRYIWIDAICINQTDNEEKQTQINLMSKIYERAALVQVWLGLEDSSTKLASQTVQKIVRYHITKYKGMESNYDPDLTLWNHLRMEGSLPTEFIVRIEEELVKMPLNGHKWLITLDEWNSFVSLIQRQWFKRVWVVQELCRAKVVQISCGMQNIVWEDLYRALMILTPARDVFSSGPHIWKRVSEGNTAFVCAELHSRLNLGIDYAIPNMSNIVSWSESSRLPLAALLLLTWNFKATDPRDKVYALLGLAEDWNTSHIIQPDYRLPVTDVFTKATQQLMGGLKPIDDPADDVVDATKLDVPDLKPLEILTFAGQSNNFAQTGLPSWVPDFGSPPHGPRLWYPEYFPSQLGSAVEISYPSPGILRTRGSPNEVIVQLEETHDDLTSKDVNRFITWLRLLPAQLDKDTILTLWQCLAVTRSTDRHKYPPAQTQSAFLEYMRYCAQKRLIYERKAEPNERNLFMWRDNWQRLADSDAQNHESNFPHLSEIEEALEDPDALEEINATSPEEFYSKARAFLSPLAHFTRSRYLFRTDTDNLGIAPLRAETGDYICSIGGASTLFVVRSMPVETGPERWMLVGETFMPFHARDKQVRWLEFQ